MFDCPSLLPEELTSLPPGPELARVLASVDVSSLTSADLYILSSVRASQIAFEESQLLAVMLEAAYAERAEALRRKANPRGSLPSGPVRAADLDEFSGDQLAFMLNRARVTAHAQLLLARDLVERIPVVFTALRSGRIDLARARAFSDGLSGLGDERARAIADKLILKAEGWTPGILRERLRYHVLKADPSLAREKYEWSVADRKVFLQPYADGTAQVGGVNLPPHLASAAYDRIDRMARAAKSAGDQRTLPQLRADAYLDVLSGRPFLLSPRLDELTAAADEAARNLGLSTDDPSDLAGTQPPPPACPRPGTTTSKTTKASQTDVGDDPGLSDGDSSGGDVGGGVEPIGFATFGPDAPPELDPDPTERWHGPDAAGEPPPRTPHRDVQQTQSEHPTPEPEQVVPVASDDPRMCVCGGVRPAPRRGVVDLHLELSTLMCLNDNPGVIPGYGPVIAEIARKVAHDQETHPAWMYSITDEDGNLLHHGPIRRRPNATETAFVKARDRKCRAPGCRRPARNRDRDHRQEWANGGPSHRANICTLCPHHHRLRHERGFVIHNISAHTVMWDAPNGLHYIVLPDATLIPFDTDEPRPTQAEIDEAFGYPPLEDAYGRS
jgi:uncharacterized protein DUF222